MMVVEVEVFLWNCDDGDVLSLMILPVAEFLLKRWRTSLIGGDVLFLKNDAPWGSMMGVEVEAFLWNCDDGDVPSSMILEVEEALHSMLAEGAALRQKREGEGEMFL
jgi:hypothetical protein